jgi:ligand-binding sensor domain-containing protein/signal transduction histidine kinase
MTRLSESTAARGFGLMLAALFCLLAPNTHANTAPEPANYFFEAWPTADGVDLNSVTTIVQSHDGYLWLGTYNGLVRFDGVRLTLFGPGGVPGLKSGRITALYEDDNHELWIGHETGELSRHKAGRFLSVPLGFDWVGGPIETISQDQTGDLWLASNAGGLFRLRDGHCGLLDLPGKGWPAWMSRDKTGKLWIISNGAMGTLEDGTYLPFRFDEQDLASHNNERVLPARDGGIWVLRDQQLGKWRDGGWSVPLRGAPWKNDYATGLLETPSGSLLVGTMKSGLYLFGASGESRHFSRADGLSSDQVNRLYQDREGNIWIGTGDGLNAMRVRKVRMLAPPDDWKGCKVLSFVTQPDGSAWIGTQGAGLYHFEAGRWSCLSESNGLPNSFIWSVLNYREHRLLLGTWGGGLLAQAGERFEPKAEFRDIGTAALALYEGKDGALWIGTRTGLCRYENDRVIWVARKEQLLVPDVRTIRETPDGALWFGMSGGGLARLENGVLRRFTRQDGLCSDFICCLYAEENGTLWIGSSDNGICRWSGGAFAALGKAQGLPSGGVTQIVDDGEGNLWFGTQHGIVCAGKAELNRCAEGAIRRVHCLSYGKAEGLASQTCTGGFQPGACKASDGQLWFPTTKGIAIVDHSNVTTNLIPPPVVIEEFSADAKGVKGRATALAGNALRMPPGSQRFEIRYTGLSFAAPDRVRFKHRLSGLEDDWVEADTRRLAEYSYLKPGPYTFQVIACNNDDIWNETGASLSFTVLPWFWQTWWFKTAGLLGFSTSVGAAVLWIARRRARRKLEQVERQRAIERERARIARDIHDDLGASLTRITMLSQTMRSEAVGEPHKEVAADRINRTARELTLAMDEIVWAVNPKHDTLDSLASYLSGYAQDFLSGAGIGCRLELPMRLPARVLTAEVRHNLFLAFKEALNNIVKHSSATEVEISLRLAENGFTLELADNGCGFVINGANGASGPGKPAGFSRGNGLLNIKKRLEEVAVHCDWHTAPGQGTRVTMTIPTETNRPATR